MGFSLPQRFFFAFVFILSSLVLHSQDLQQTISLNVRNKPIHEVIREISTAAQVKFSYNPEIIPAGKKITVNARSRPLREILDLVFTRNGIEYILVEDQIVLRPAVPDEAQRKEIPMARTVRHTLSGFVYDKSSGEALIGANIFIRGASAGATTNGYGFFSLTLPAGKYSVGFSYIGFQSKEMLAELTEDVRLRIELEAGLIEMKEVEIRSGETTATLHALQMSEFTFSNRTLKRLPGFGGDMDIIRSLQSVPGIHSFGDGSSFFYVRGGNHDQNLLLIDEVPVYNPSHLFGFFSAFSPDAINSVQVFKGDFPARFGGRLSSVIDIKAREGNLRQHGFSGNIGPYASNLTIEGPILRNRASYLLSGRFSTLGWLNSIPVFNHNFGFLFFDLNGKMNFIVNNNNRFFITLYYGLDDFSRFYSNEVNSMGIGWRNTAATLRWNHLFSPKIFTNTTLNFSRYRYFLNLPQEQNGYWSSSIANLTLKSDGAWYLQPENTLRAGAEITWHHCDPGNVRPNGESLPEKTPVVSEYQSMEYVFYVSNEQKVGKKWSLRYGIRLPFWQDFGPTRVYYFDANHQVIDTIAIKSGRAYSLHFSPEPRVNVQYRLNAVSSLKASYCRTTQFMQLLSNSVSPFNSLEVWVPCGPNIPPQKADQVAAGYFREFPATGLSLSVEAYAKWFYDRPDYRDHANLLFNPLIEGELRFGKGHSYGIEWMIRKTTGRWTGWLGYTFSRTRVQTPEISNGRIYPAAYDRPHDLSLNLTWEDHKHWILTLNWIFMTGAVTTTPSGFYAQNGSMIPIYDDRNNSRLPDYHRLDLSATWLISKPGNRYQHSVALSIYNAYGRLNPFSVSYNKIMNDQGEFVVPSNTSGTYERIPTAISVAGIIPSINYLFRF